MGRPFFWENSYRGTSVFCFNFAKTSGQYGFWGGVNTNELRPFEVILDV